MRDSGLDFREMAAPDAAWMTQQHERLDARLASAFLEMVWGTGTSARREFDVYRQRLSSHLKEVERRLFSAIAALDARTHAMERFEWNAHARDLRQAFASVERELRLPNGGRSAAFAALRRAMRRQRRHEHHLLKLATRAESREPETAEALL